MKTAYIGSVKTILDNIYIDFFNNYLTVEKYAYDNNLTVEQAEELIPLAKTVFNHGKESV